MSFKTTLFVANWKMNGKPSDFKELSRVGAFLNKNLKKYKKSIVFCPPASLLSYFFKKNTCNKICFGAQDISNTNLSYGAATGLLSANILKLSGAEYTIIGHSEKRLAGDNPSIIKNKLILANKNNLKSIFCIGETLNQKKKNQSITVLKKQILQSITKKTNFNNVVFAYEPIWSIGSGLIPSRDYLEKTFSFINFFLKTNYMIKNPKILYGGSVNSNNIKDLKQIKACSGYLIGGASLKAKNFIEIIKNYYN